MSTSPDAPPPRKPGPSILVSVLVMLAGAAIAITGLAVGVSSAIHRVTHVADGPRGELPSRFDATLQPQPGRSTSRIHPARRDPSR